MVIFSQTENLEKRNLLQKTCQRELMVSKVSSFAFIWIPVKSMEIFAEVKALARKLWPPETVRIYSVKFEWYGWSSIYFHQHLKWEVLIWN